MIAYYGRWAARSGNVMFEGELPSGGFIAASWHCNNLLVMGIHAELRPQPYRAFVPPGLSGTIMRGCLRGYGVEPVPLPLDGVGNPAAGLKEMAQAVRDGWAAGIAVDGPHGPARVLRPGALWLARLTGRPLIVVGAAAKPCLHLPWWDSHVVPFPHSKVGLVYGEPILIPRGTDIDPSLCAGVSTALDAVERRAQELVA
jgi:lysophospholipid acyltransferase (LPLAT)-like uncharacterized protein